MPGGDQIANARLRAIADWVSEPEGGNPHFYILFKDGSELEYFGTGTPITPGGQAGWLFRPADEYDSIFTPDNGSNSVLWSNDNYPYNCVSAYRGSRGYPINSRFRFPTN